MKRILTILLTFVLALGLMSCGKSSSNSQSSTVAVEKIIDVNQFARITSEDLKKIMGEPENIEDWNFDSSNGKSYPTKTYTYKNGEFEFMIIDNSVVRMNIHSEKYNKTDGKSITFNDEKSLFSILGIEPSSNVKKVDDTGAALKYQLVSDKVAEVWVAIMDKKAKTMDEIKITYNLNYFS